MQMLKYLAVLFFFLDQFGKVVLGGGGGADK